MRTASRPDVQSLIAGGRELRRRRTAARFGVGLAAAAVVIGAGYGVVQLGDGGSGVDGGGPSNEPTETTDLRVEYSEGIELSAGTTYLVRAGYDADARAIDAEVRFDGPGWGSGNQPWVYDGRNTAGIAIYAPLRVRAGNDCTGSRLRPAAAEVDLLVGQLSRLPGGTVVQPATRVDAFGYEDGRHLRMRVDTTCAPSEGYKVADTPAGSHGISYEHPATSSEVVVVDFWVFDVDGKATVVERWTQAGGSPELAEQVSNTIDSVTLINE